MHIRNAFNETSQLSSVSFKCSTVRAGEVGEAPAETTSKFFGFKN